MIEAPTGQAKRDYEEWLKREPEVAE